MTDGLNPNHRDAIIEKLSANPKVERIVLFGSRAMGTFTTTSDVDLALFGSELTLSDQATLSEAMAELSIPQRVDILIHHRIESQALREHIRKYGVEWFARKRAAGAANMAGEWIKCTLADACRSINYGLTASTSEYEVGPKFLRITDIVNGHIDWNVVPHVAADEVTAAKYRLYDGDIVLARTGASTGASAYVKNPPPSVFASYLVRLQAKSEFDARFLAYYLRSDNFWTFIRGVLGDKSAQPNASASTMTKAPLCAPKDKDEQRAIACILGTLDDKIELNRRMSETLEEMARAIFKSWFVDFDPVRAKAAVRREHPDWTNAQVSRAACPNLKPEIAELFPDRLVDSELGEIPEGWRIQSFIDDVEVISGGTPKTSNPDYWGGHIPWFSVADTPAAGEIFVICTERTITQDGVNNSSTRVLPIGTTIISARGTVGNLALVAVSMAMNQSCYGLHDLRGHIGYFLYFTTAAVVETLRLRTHGSVFNTITRDTLKSVRVVTPPNALITEFERAVGAMLQRNLNALLESSTLAALRDTLLPKLISGEIRVKDAERIVGRCI